MEESRGYAGVVQGKGVVRTRMHFEFEVWRRWLRLRLRLRRRRRRRPAPRRRLVVASQHHSRLRLRFRLRLMARKISVQPLRGYDSVAPKEGCAHAHERTTRLSEGRSGGGSQ